MTTLKDKIRDIVIGYQKEKGDDPEVLVEDIIETISDEIRTFLDKILN